MVVFSPYPAGPFKQFKGNLHTHTRESDGAFHPQQTIHRYEEMGYDFLAISDHDQITDIRTLNPCGLTLLPANEITDDGPHVLHVLADYVVAPHSDRQVVLDEINKGHGVAIMNHPNWGVDFNHCPQELLAGLTGYVGIEIYNGVSERAEGSALATDRWDQLLSQGKRVWGFGNDDCHESRDFGIVWNMVFAEDTQPATLLEAMKKGRFYVSSGVYIDTIEVTDRILHMKASHAEAFRVVSDHGMILHTTEGNELQFPLPGPLSASYIRVECFGKGTRMAWTQPFWIE